jgi:enoyl-CoA hydratase/carnithine racemase
MNSLTAHREGPVTILTMRRPPINALDRAALEELSEAVKRVEADEHARVLVITGGIEGFFCTGGDLKYWRRFHDGKEVSRAGWEVFTRIERLSIPTIAAINGHVIGDGLTLAVVCDFRMASESATFRVPEAAYGFVPGWGLMRRLVALVGRGRASALLMTGEPIDAARAHMMGLVNDVVPTDRLMASAMCRARQMAALSPVSLRTLKCVLLGGDERSCFDAVWGKADWSEGIDSLIAKRAPAFPSGRNSDECCNLNDVETSFIPHKMLNRSSRIKDGNHD